MVIYQLVEPGNAKCKQAFIKESPASLNLLRRDGGGWLGTFELKAFDVENSFYNLERCFIASSIEFKWAPGNPKFVAIESKIWPDFKKHLWSTSIWNVSKGIGNFTGKYTTGKQSNPLLAPIEGALFSYQASLQVHTQRTLRHFNAYWDISF